MLSGSCVQYVNDKKIHLKEGELLLLDKEIVQRIDPLEEEDLLINILLKGESITTDIVINMVKSRGLVNEFLLNASQEKGLSLTRRLVRFLGGVHAFHIIGLGVPIIWLC